MMTTNGKMKETFEYPVRLNRTLVRCRRHFRRDDVDASTMPRSVRDNEVSNPGAVVSPPLLCGTRIQKLRRAH